MLVTSLLILRLQSLALMLLVRLGGVLISD